MADEIFASRDAKPIIAQVNALCASAGYWLASACNEIVITQSGEIGSIGVYTIHEEISKLLETEGVKETIISAGKYKVEGNPFEPLGEEAKAAIQMSVDGYYTMFVDAVARYRGVTSQAVRDGFGQGRVARAPDSIGIGLADRVGTLSETLQRFGVRMGSASKKAMRAEEETPQIVAEAPALTTPRLNIARRKLDLDSVI
jgi:signal peptide peptidase SppA